MASTTLVLGLAIIHCSEGGQAMVGRRKQAVGFTIRVQCDSYVLSYIRKYSGTHKGGYTKFLEILWKKIKKLLEPPNPPLPRQCALHKIVERGGGL